MQLVPLYSSNIQHTIDESRGRTVVQLELADYLSPGGRYPYEQLPQHAETLLAHYAKAGPASLYVQDVPHLSFVLSGDCRDGVTAWTTDGWEHEHRTAADAWRKRW